MSDANHLTKKCINYKKNYRTKQLALKALNNYLEQLKIHYDLKDGDLVKLLKNILKVKNKNNFINKLWNIFN